jgi:hypothetical protein
MNKIQYLLGKVAEECIEVAQRALKAQQFGLEEREQITSLNNWERMEQELNDLDAVIKLLEEEYQKTFFIDYQEGLIKKDKVDRYYKYSQSLGMVDK